MAGGAFEQVLEAMVGADVAEALAYMPVTKLFYSMGWAIMARRMMICRFGCMGFWRAGHAVRPHCACVGRGD